MMPRALAVGLLALLAASPIAVTAQSALSSALEPGRTGPSQPISLTAEDMRVLAQELLAAGDPAAAGEVLNALLVRDPNDVAALILGAQSALDQNRPDAALPLAMRGFQQADDDVARYVAARLAARSHAALDQDTRAQIWLRRARQTAPNSAEAESVAQDYTFLRNRNPLSVALNFGVSPSSNINNGSRFDTTTIGQFETRLSESAKPLSGIQYDVGGTLRYRLRESETAMTTAEFDLRTTTYSLSSSAKDGLQSDIDNAIARGFSADDLPRAGDDFAYTLLSVGLEERRILREGLQPTTFVVGAGRSWYGGDPYQTFVILGAAQTIPLGTTEQIRFNANLRNDFADRAASEDVFSYSAGLSYARVLESGNLISLSLSDRISQSDDSERDYRSLQLGVSLDLGQPILNTRFGFGAQIEERKFDGSIYVQGIRRDRSISVQATALFDSVEYYGFNPAVTVSLGRTYSAAERFDTQYGNIGFDLRSAF